MREDARKIPVAYKLKPEVVAMIDEMRDTMKARGWSKTNIIEQAITDWYWKNFPEWKKENSQR